MKVQIDNLAVRYGATTAIASLDLTLEPGEILTVIGPNGSGKSSLVKAIGGLVPYRGRILFDGATKQSQRLGYMPQDTGSRAALTVLEAVLLGRLGRLGLRVRPEDIAATEAVIAELDLAGLASRYLGELSGGQRQLVFLAQALAGEPTLLLLDEPISALDIRHQLEVMQTVRRLTKERGLTTLVVLHDLNIAARFADKIAAMRQGELVCLGEPARVVAPDVVAEVFEVESALSIAPDGRPVITPVRPL